MLALAACGGDAGDESGSNGETSAADTSAADTSGASTGAEPTGGETAGETSAGPTSDATTGDAPTSDATTGDPTGGGLADCGFDDGAVFDRTGLVFQLISEDGEACVWLRRRDDSEPDVIYKAVPYTLLEMKAGKLGAVDHLSDPANMTWESTHHNWADVAEAWDDRVRYRLEDWYGMAFLDEFGLSAYDEQTDALLWGPVKLTPYTP